jgi:long-chain fatty acid transport protein
MKKISTLLFVVIFCSSLFAGGFQINNQGARAMGMGNAFTSVVNDASAIYWNGAGLVNTYGTNFMLGTALTFPSTKFMGIAPATDEYEQESQMFYPTHFFASTKITPNFAAGIGFNTPFGLGSKWENDWIGSFLSVETELQVFTVSPVLAYRIMDGLSLSAAFVYSWANVTIARNVALPAPAGTAFVTMEGEDNSSFGYNFGLMYKPTDRFSAGVSFRSEIEYNFEGNSTVENATNPVYNTLFTSPITADLTTPMNLQVGVSYKFTPELLLAADFQYVGWSSYDSLTIVFNPPIGRAASPREYDNSFIARLGGEYTFSRELAMQAGVYYDVSPVKEERNSPSLPESDRLGLSLGLSYKLAGALGVQLSYLYVHSFELEVDNSLEMAVVPGRGVFPCNGTYNASASVLSLGFTYSF